MSRDHQYLPQPFGAMAEAHDKQRHRTWTISSPSHKVTTVLCSPYNKGQCLDLEGKKERKKLQQMSKVRGRYQNANFSSSFHWNFEINPPPPPPIISVQKVWWGFSLAVISQKDNFLTFESVPKEPRDDKMKVRKTEILTPVLRKGFSFSFPCYLTDNLTGNTENWSWKCLWSKHLLFYWASRDPL